ncbi:hypothetical protein M3152_05290 [Sporosarcina luteola]|uniref:hypothetical protein n=1 Tax=Bacillales TaxID=1385 RepID=UPI00203E91B8|nr:MULTISPECIES: hypothetical protein [Bacillales]MCM3637130.1 hypothetical protein [Sporosarcina luteola]
MAQVKKLGDAIFNIALAQMQSKIEESLFVDDKIENIAVAEKVGMKGLHLDKG